METTFHVLKQAMTSTLILVMSNFNDPFVIESDASVTGIGAILNQQGRPSLEADSWSKMRNSNDISIYVRKEKCPITIPIV